MTWNVSKERVKRAENAYQSELEQSIAQPRTEVVEA